MQITIAQDEIETAIRNHILGLISVNGNSEITIDLKATRGSEGFTALIDIMPQGSSSAKPAAPKAVETKTESKPAAKAYVAPDAPTQKVAAPEPEAEPEAPAAKDAEAEPAPEPKAEPEVEAKKTPALPFAKKAEATAAAAPATKPAASIFANVKAVSNKPAEAPAE